MSEAGEGEGKPVAGKSASPSSKLESLCAHVALMLFLEQKRCPPVSGSGLIEKIV